MDEKKQEVVINPFTGRTIRVSGRTYRLVQAELMAWLEQQCAAGPDPNREKLYCGSKNLPAGYSRAGTSQECLRRGFKTGLCSVYQRFNR